MSENKKKAAASAAYEVGYGKPPVHSRFKTGQSGNPRGRRRDTAQEKARGLMLKEVYRPVTVREGDNVISMPALRAVLRSHIALAVKGNGPAQRALFKMVEAIERDLAEAAKPAPAKEEEKLEPPSMTENDVARRIAFVLAKAAREQKKRDEPPA